MKVFALNNQDGSDRADRSDRMDRPATHETQKPLDLVDRTDDKDFVDNAVLATYVESLKMFAKDSPNIDKKLLGVIQSLPAPDTVRSSMGYEESAVLQESVNWAWKQITGNKMVDELKITKAPEHMMGNYWMLKNGVILEGINHLTIIRNNLSLMAILLNLDQMAILGNMLDPNKCIHMVIANGAIRAFVNHNKECFFQMTSQTYGDWGRNKIKKLDFPHKTVKVIDLKQPYAGWDTGISVKI